MEGKCGSCRKIVKTNESAVECDLCKFWFHTKCAEVKDTLVKFLESKDGQDANVHWYCKICGQSTKKLLDQMSSIDVRMTIVEEKLDAISTKLDELVKSWPESTLSAPVGKVAETAIEPKVVTALTNELREREKRATNVVFTGEATEEKIKSVVEKAGIDPPLKIITVGKPDKKLYIVSLKTEGDKWKLISKARSICMANEGLNGVYVNPDLTKSERDLQYQLRQELKRRRALGENVVIKRGVVVSKDK